MHYPFNDVQRLMASVPLLTLAKPASALRFLASKVEAGDELTAMLQSYPSVRYEPLDFHYACQQSLATIDEALLSDLFQHHGWHGIVWGSFLATLAPDRAFKRHLESVVLAPERGGWLVESALQALAGSEPGSEQQKLLARLRGQLAPLPKLSLKLQPAVSELEDLARKAIDS